MFPEMIFHLLDIFIKKKKSLDVNIEKNNLYLTL